MRDRTDFAADIKRTWVDVRAVLEALRLLDGAQRERAGFIIRCPWHNERTPSCSVQVKGGVVLAHCFACDRNGSVLDLVAAIEGLDTARDFPAVVRRAAELAGRHDIIAELEGKADAPPRPAPKPRTAPPPEPERTYPPADELAELWESCKPVTADDPACAWLRSRALEPEAVAVRDLARALPRTAALPRWAWGPGGSWIESGHRLIVALHDAAGIMRTVRAGRIIEGNTPKRLPPAGHKAGQVVMADTIALEVLRLGKAPDYIAEPLRIVIAEGEPDWLTWATNRPLDSRKPLFGVLGIIAGAWCAELAARIPSGAHVIIRTDHDRAGEKYADDIIATLASRCTVRRTRPTP
jgi:hypothetical protein